MKHFVRGVVVGVSAVVATSVAGCAGLIGDFQTVDDPTDGGGTTDTGVTVTDSSAVTDAISATDAAKQCEIGDKVSVAEGTACAKVNGNYTATIPASVTNPACKGTVVCGPLGKATACRVDGKDVQEVAAVEVCGDNVDNNCNGSVDEGCACKAGETSYCFTGTAATCPRRCNSGTALNCPANPPLRDCSSASDNNCNGVPDNTEPECKCGGIPIGGTIACVAPNKGECAKGSDTCKLSADKTMAMGTGVCTPKPPAAETTVAGTCGNGLDDDCDGNIDGNDPDCTAKTVVGRVCYLTATNYCAGIQSASTPNVVTDIIVTGAPVCPANYTDKGTFKMFTSASQKIVSCVDGTGHHQSTTDACPGGYTVVEVVGYMRNNSDPVVSAEEVNMAFFANQPTGTPSAIYNWITAPLLSAMQANGSICASAPSNLSAARGAK